MMNKIYEAFDKVKIDQRVKEKALNKLEERKLKYKYITNKWVISRALALTFTTVFIIILVNGHIPQKSAEEDTRVGTMSIQENSKDSFLYAGDTYYLTEDDASKYEVGDKLGGLTQIKEDGVLKDDLISYYDIEATVYSSNNQKVLIVKTADKILVYRRS